MSSLLEKVLVDPAARDSAVLPTLASNTDDFQPWA